jgi:hypothetical protein
MKFIYEKENEYWVREKKLNLIGLIGSKSENKI